MKELLLIIGLVSLLTFDVEARSHYTHHYTSYHHIYRPIVRHHSYHSGWHTFGGVVAGTVIGSLLVKDTYIAYNQRINIPQYCVTFVNQNTGMITTQCAQDSNQVIYMTE